MTEYASKIEHISTGTHERLLVAENRTSFMSGPFLEGHKSLPDMRVRQARRDNNRDVARTGQEGGLFQCISIYIEPSH